MRFLRPALALLLLAGLLPAPAAEAARAVRGSCEGGTCTWFRELSRDVAGASARGTLLRLEIRWWTSADRQGSGEEEGRQEILYFLCSGSGPALVGREGRRWRERPLDPGQPAPADRAVATAYGWVCHGIVPGARGPSLADLYPNRPAALREGRLLQRPEDVLR
ncbi:hypothetical protein [Roseomonas indoligenes]|uniref:DUF2147 domain-containing protein n=1 Tax=Roseomonas indoligenes TaxID=2820811 RepID=A0A940N399_9PROT|nr:hypothetical protein [Pararoseomonas indoligenes]MBP0495226.1 hypothetical protein [Pararoseomonas indoligenes]